MQVKDTTPVVSQQLLPPWWTGDSPFPRRAPGKRGSKAGRKTEAIEPDDSNGWESDYGQDN